MSINIMDNFRFEMVGRDRLAAALKVAAREKEMTGAMVFDGDLCLYSWVSTPKPDGYGAFPVSVPIEDLVPMIEKWLAKQPKLHKQPDIDGDWVEGWRVFADDVSPQAVTVSFAWALLGK